MGKDVSIPGMCDDLESCLAADLSCVPTLEYRIANFELPFDNSDIALLSSIPVNLFVADPTVQTNTQRFAASNAVAQNSLEIVGNFLLLGICVWAEGEGMALSAEGNWAGKMEDVVNDFASPYVVRNDDPGYQAQLGLDDAAKIHPAEVNFGAPVWRVIENFLAGYTLKLYCPNDSNVQLLEEPVSEIGNCCASVDWNGFSRTNHGTALIERQINNRLDGIKPAVRPDDIYDGRFRVLNSDQGPATFNQGFQQGDLVPSRYEAQPAAFGRVRGNPSIAYWYKMPVPLSLVNGTLLRIEFTSDAGHIQYVNEMLRVGTMQLLKAWANMGVTNYPYHENNHTGTADGLKVYIPGGRVRIGIGLKGFKVASNVCQRLVESQQVMGLDSARVMKGLCGSQFKEKG